MGQVGTLYTINIIIDNYNILKSNITTSDHVIRSKAPEQLLKDLWRDKVVLPTISKVKSECSMSTLFNLPRNIYYM